ncbi:EF-hand domain-containing protein [Sphingomonas cavernae]|uniref:EF-hand domain-containing protein n=1 Tax=Sphingomonas cavernae TaxID=2320861 RepID=A0A418WR34_9SPHN|nr:EF-hand domain-containing protein [Sphingomonas cavernae]RJF93687.1 EF-hand domain-containing protein [Sphingomonas cavernae]
MKRSLFAAFAILAIGGTAHAGDMWKTADTDADGRITRAEYDASVTAGWTKKDANADGQLSASEAMAKAGDAKWKAADADGNGSLSQTEYMAMKSGWFAKADANKDGSLSKAEGDLAMASK